MLNLIIKDMLVQKRELKSNVMSLVVIILFIFALQFLGAPCVYMVFPFLFSISYIISSCGALEKNDVDVLINSLPVKRKDIVFSKYASALILFLIGILLDIIVLEVLKILGLSHIKRFNFTYIIISLSYCAFYVSVYLPVYFSLGNIKAQGINTILLMCTTIFLIITVTIFTVVENGNAKASLIKLFKMNNFNIFLIVGCIIFSVVVTIISCVISLLAYKNRDI